MVISTNHASHAEIGIMFMKVNKHVFIEKPMTVCIKDAQLLAKTADEHPNLTLMVNHTSNFRQKCLKAKQLIDSGKLGKINHVLAVMYAPLLWMFEDPDNTSYTKPTGSMLANGFGWGQICHLLGWVHYVTNLKSKEITAVMHFSKKSGADLINAGLVKCENGESISISAGTCWPGTGVTTAEMSKHFDIKIFGSEGVMSYGGKDTDEKSGRLEIRLYDDTDGMVFEGFNMENAGPGGLGPESLRNFVEACNGGQFVNACDQHVGLRVVETVHGLYESGVKGGTYIVE